VSTELGIPREDLSPESSIAEDLGLDRWDLFELVEHLEAVYRASLEDKVVARLESLSDLAHALESATSAPSPLSCASGS
jgi:acyl carrier protein